MTYCPVYQVEQFELSFYLSIPTFRVLHFMDRYIHFNTVCLYVQEESLS